MPMPLLATKLHIPPARPATVPRPRLVERLNAGLQARLILVSAPAGFGKTTLLVDWVRGGAVSRPPEPDGPHSPPGVAWLTLDEDDNDPGRFWAYVVAALQTVPALRAAGVGDSMLAGLGARPLATAGAPPVEALLAELINEVAAAAAGPLLLVLDDYHLVEAEAIHRALSFLVEHLPAQMHLVIATRADPPLPLARLRGRGQLAELRQADLRFTPQEAGAFLERCMGLELSAGDVAALAGRTEGWVAGLQMAAVSLQGRADANAFIQAFGGSHRHILDYLVEEVLQRQPESIQTFLLQTAILDRLSEPLCAAVTGQAGAGATLEALGRNNLFVFPLDDERRWYRYHRLFADLLRKRLRQLHPERVPELHRRASAWYEEHGLPAAAIDHALSASDWARAAQLVEEAAEPALMGSELGTLLRWLGALPEPVVRARPLLGIYHATALLLGGQPLEAVQARLREVAVAPSAASLVGEVSAIRAVIAAFQGDAPRGIELSRRALERLPARSLFLRSIVADNLGIAYMMNGDLGAACRTLEEAAGLAQEAGNLAVVVGAWCNLGGIHMVQGELRRADAIYRRALELAGDAQGRRLPVAGKALLGLGELAREWNDLEAAERYVTEGIDLLGRWVQFGPLVGYVGLARVRRARGDVEGAREAILQAEQLARRFDATEVDDRIVAAHRAWLAIGEGDLQAAGRWAEERGLLSRGTPTPVATGEPADTWLDYQQRKTECATLARLMLAEGRPAEALSLLDSILPTAERLGRGWAIVEIQALRALALRALGDRSQALATLERALALAEPEGHVRVFVDEGAPMETMLGELGERKELRGKAPECGPSVGYVQRLLAAFGQAEPLGCQVPSVPSAPSVSPVPSAPVVEPLSEREVEVLGLIAEGLSNREVALRLFISPGTVKVHTRNIYGKLAVTSRTRAVARARALGILR